MSGGLEFAWAEAGDLVAVEAFHGRHFGADAVQALPGRVRWLYFENPLGLHVALCRDGGELVACCGHLPQPVTVGGRAVTAGFGIDFMVAPSHRRRGIGRRFLEMRLERFALSLSTGQSPAMAALYAAAGGVDLGPLLVGLRRRRPPAGGPPRELLRGWALWLAGAIGSRAAAADLRPVGLDEAAAVAGGAGAEAAAWFRWRYGGPVYRDHRFVAGEDAVLAWREGPDGLRHVVGLAGEPRRRAGLVTALAALPGAAETRVLGSGDRLRADLRRAGCVVRTTGARLVGATRDRRLAGALVPGAVELDAGAADADLLRRPATPDLSRPAPGA